MPKITCPAINIHQIEYPVGNVSQFEEFFDDTKENNDPVKLFDDQSHLDCPSLEL